MNKVSDNPLKNRDGEISPYVIVTALFVMCYVVSNLMPVKVISFFGLFYFDAGTITFPLAYTQRLSCIGLAQTGDSDEAAGGNLLRGSEFVGGVPAQLNELFRDRFALLVDIIYRCAYFQAAAGDFQPA